MVRGLVLRPDRVLLLRPVEAHPVRPPGLRRAGLSRRAVAGGGERGCRGPLETHCAVVLQPGIRGPARCAVGRVRRQRIRALLPVGDGRPHCPLGPPLPDARPYPQRRRATGGRGAALSGGAPADGH